MKFQDIFLIVAFVALILIRKPKLIAVVGLLYLFAAIPLFTFWIFFSAERLVYYGVFYLLGAVVMYSWIEND